MEETGCDLVMVGSGAMGNPWLFRQLKDPAGLTPPGKDEIRALVIRMVADVVREKGEVRGVRESRSRAAYFIRGLRGSASLRDRHFFDQTHHYEKAVFVFFLCAGRMQSTGCNL
jgi:tRNA-dihydrouridine synthase